MEENQKFSNSKEVLSFLAKMFPKCFSLEQEAKPLKIGIFHDLAERLAQDDRVSNRLLRMALRHYTSSWKYLASIKEGAARIDLDGNEGDKVETEHSEHAQVQLKESKAKAAEKRRQQKLESTDKSGPSNRNKSASKNTPKTTSKKNTPTKTNHNKAKPSINKVQVRELSNDDIKVGTIVSVKVGKTPMPATITDVSKDGIQVQLNSGMSVKVQLEQLRLTN